MDGINGCFEAVGGIMSCLSAWRVYKDKGYAGIHILAASFFMSWGIWNLFYYPHLGQWCSFVGGATLACANIVWVSLMTYYGRKA